MTREGQLHTPASKRQGRERVPAPLAATAATLSDLDLLTRVLSLAEAERGATVELLVHLAELDSRKLYLGQGYGSLFSYCTGALRLAEYAAYNRIEAARASRRFPAILDLLADGSLNLATVRLLAPHLRPDNFDALVGQARGKSKREVEALVACLAPRPDVASSVRKLPERLVVGPGGTVVVASGDPQPAAQPLAACGFALASATAVSGTRATSESVEPRDGCTAVFADDLESQPFVRHKSASLDRPTDRPVVAPLAPARYRVQFTVGGPTHEKLRRAQDLLRREIPDGDPGAIFDRALTLLLEDIARRKLAETSRPKPRPVGAGSTRSRHIPAHVKRAVWLRDGGRCAFVAPNGRCCTERAFLEFHHDEPHAIGGEATVANISLRCRLHNVYEAVLAFGPGVASVERNARSERDARVERADSPRGESAASCRGTMRARPQEPVAQPKRPSMLPAVLANESAALATQSAAFANESAVAVHRSG